jgi:hypothetical protein
MNNAMNEVAADINEVDVLAYEIADAALEAAACAGPMGAGAMGATAFTIAMCTGQVECPF